MAANNRWIVTTSGKDSLGDIKKQLTEKGFTVEQVMDEIGCITGTATEEAVKKMKTIPGVTDISPDTDINIGPPDSPVTW
jgi:predicted transcriptional regulator